MFQSKIKTILDESKNILLCGCGGGYDIYTGMPILYEYQEKTTLANITFSSISLVQKILDKKEVFVNGYEEIDYKTCKEELKNYYPKNYVPEYWLSKYLNKKVYTILPSGVQTLCTIFSQIINDNQIDTIVLVDGGIDSMMFGDEQDIGTYSEDISTMLAVSLLPVKKVLVTTAWGVEGHLSHNRFFENVATLIRQDGFLGSQSLEKDSANGVFYTSVLEACFPPNSTINICIHASITGQRWNKPHKWALQRHSDYQVNSTFSLQDWVGCPLGGIYWFFDLDKVVPNIVYKDNLMNTIHLSEVDRIVHHYRYDKKLVNDEGKYVGERTSSFF